MSKPNATSVARTFFNTQHSPIGAHASFTLGYPGAKGGLDLEICSAPDQSFVVALESASEPGLFEALPFCEAPDDSERARFMEITGDTRERGARLRIFEQAEVRREFALATDAWHAGDLVFTLYSPVRDLPDPETGDALALKRSFVPAVRAELTIDNRHGHTPRRVVLGMSRQGRRHGLHHLALGDAIRGIGDGLHLGYATDAPGAWSGVGFDPLALLSDPHPINRGGLLGGWGMLVCEVPAGQVSTLRYAFAMHRAGAATVGLDTRYYYTRWFGSTDEVLRFALEDFDEAVAVSREADARLARSPLSEAQKFIVAHATRSYLYSTQLLEHEGKPLWVVNEGEYNMINTLDLAGDHSLYECRHHPWTIRNVLEQYVARYSFEDTVQIDGLDGMHPGGVSFTHDMGVSGVFSPAGRSAYEQAGIEGCFSHMTTEELLNWINSAGLYVEQSGDLAWARTQSGLLARCLASLEARDHPDPAQRRGVPHANSSRCEGGREITTYDCLDPSLGQAAGNTYIAGKAWGAYLILARLFDRLEKPELARRAEDQALRCGRTVVGAVDTHGRIPALIEGDSGAVILPVIEALAYPWLAGCRSAMALDGVHADYFAALVRHMREHVLREDTCIYPDGGWRITSANDNTFPAKVYVCQFVAREILRMDVQALSTRADQAHADWLTDPDNSYFCWFEQASLGKVHGAKYYPRGVTANLWLEATTQS
ncbi:glycoside hydrolase family 52 protein [Niveibacterium sp. SC-1]|uniref:glycoside hydrolase family 52 protein n=1 Tax=Niveibacterium sp. SC-1 TaxID=3135646 RepID=UPI00311E3AB7